MGGRRIFVYLETQRDPQKRRRAGRIKEEREKKKSPTKQARFIFDEKIFPLHRDR